jgi:hypothetical protein
MRSHRPGGWWVGSTGHYEDNTGNGASAGYWVRPHPPKLLCGPWQVFECLAGDVAFETAHDLASRQAFGFSPPDVVAGLVVAAHAGEEVKGVPCLISGATLARAGAGRLRSQTWRVCQFRHDRVLGRRTSGTTRRSPR